MPASEVWLPPEPGAGIFSYSLIPAILIQAAERNFAAARSVDFGALMRRLAIAA
jgi:hypothetical protein